MPRALLGCLTIVAAFQIQLAAASAVVEEAPVTPAVAELAARLSIDPLRDPTRFLGDMARALYALLGAKPIDLRSRPSVQPRPSGEQTVTVPVPLPNAVWARAVFGHAVAPDQLLAEILSDRRAALLCRGLGGLDEETLTYLAEHPAIVSMLYERAAANFGAFGAALHIRDGRVVTPGGEEFAGLWQEATEVSPDRPDLFIRQLFTEYDGRLAYLYDVIDSASPDAARFALGASLPERLRTLRFRSLVAGVAASYHEWRPGDHPFVRPLGDLGMMLMRVKLTPEGVLAPPASRGLWREAFESDGGELLSGDTVDAAWLVAATGSDDMYTRLERLDQIAFAQRVFGRADVPPSVVVEVVRPLRRHKMLMLALERMGITAPDVYVSATERAAALTDLGHERQFWTVTEFQGSLAFLARLRRNGLIDSAQAETLTRSLVTLPQGTNGYGLALSQWWERQLAPVLPSAPSWDARAVAAMAGPSPPTETRLVWEGQLYRIDLAFAEQRRLGAIRQKQGGPTLDIAMTLATISDRLRRSSVTIDDVRDAQRALERLGRESAERLRRPPVNLPPPAVDVPPDALAAVNDAAQRLARITRPADARRAASVGESLEPLVEVVLANVLISLAYAAELGDPEGAAMLAGNVALRHDFGFGRKDAETRARSPWALPRQEFQPGVPWHVAGSLLNLDIGLAPLSLQRTSMDRIADAPKLSSIEREAMAVNVALLDPFRLTDADRDAIAQAIGRGRERVAAADSASSLTVLADELRLDGYRRRSMQYAQELNPATIPDHFTAVDLLILGGATLTDLDAWGTPALHSRGCACTAFTPSRAWYVLDGRLQLPLMAATMGDLNLTMAVMLRDLGVPTLLLKSVMAVGMQEVIDGLGNRGDWWGLSMAARSLQRQRVEDYVSASAAVDGPLVPIDDDPSNSTRAH